MRVDVGVGAGVREEGMRAKESERASERERARERERESESERGRERKRESKNKRERGGYAQERERSLCLSLCLQCPDRSIERQAHRYNPGPVDPALASVRLAPLLQARTRERYEGCRGGGAGAGERRLGAKDSPPA